MNNDVLNRLKKNANSDHLFVVIRIDDLSPNTPIEQRIALTKVFLDENAADREAARLNDLNKNKGSRYVVKVSRLVLHESPGTNVLLDDAGQAATEANVSDGAAT
jgi:hypothetical protein